MSKARVPWKAVIGGSVGNLVEWYDWFVYSSFAVYFAASFFFPGLKYHRQRLRGSNLKSAPPLVGSPDP